MKATDPFRAVAGQGVGRSVPIVDEVLGAEMWLRETGLFSRGRVEFFSP